MSIDFTTDIGTVRLLLNDIDEAGTNGGLVFSDNELQALLTLEGGSIKRAAAQAIDTNATNVALATRVLRTPSVTTDGAKLADAMRKHADALRLQANEDDDYFEVIDLNGDCWPLTDRPFC